MTVLIPAVLLATEVACYAAFLAGYYGTPDLKPARISRFQDNQERET